MLCHFPHHIILGQRVLLCPLMTRDINISARKKIAAMVAAELDHKKLLPPIIRRKRKITPIPVPIPPTADVLTTSDVINPNPNHVESNGVNRTGDSDSGSDNENETGIQVGDGVGTDLGLGLGLEGGLLVGEMSKKKRKIAPLLPVGVGVVSVSGDPPTVTGSDLQGFSSNNSIGGSGEASVPVELDQQQQQQQPVLEEGDEMGEEEGIISDYPVDIVRIHPPHYSVENPPWPGAVFQKGKIK